MLVLVIIFIVIYVGRIIVDDIIFPLQATEVFGQYEYD